MSTKRILTIILDQLETLTKASDDSFLGKLKKKKTFVVGNRPGEERDQLLSEISSYFFFEKEISLYYLMETLASLTSHLNLVAFMKPTIYYEAINVIAIRRSLDRHIKKFIHQR